MADRHIDREGERKEEKWRDTYMEREESMGWKIESQSPNKFSLKHREDTKAKTFVSTHLQENQDNYLYTFFLSYFVWHFVLSSAITNYILCQSYRIFSR
jgi:hypothetical protein